MASCCVLRKWLNAQQIMQWQWAWDARQISRQSTIPIAHFPFPFFQRVTTIGSHQCSRPETDAVSCHSSNEATGASEMPKFVVSSSQRYDCPRKDFDASWGQFRVFVGAYVLARPSFHTCIATFQTYGTLGLPMCHVFTVSGSSLPVPIFIGRWTDHINLQAEVTVSGIKLFSHMAGHEYRSRYQRVISSV